MPENVRIRLFGVFAGLFGMCGIGLAAAASHMDDQRLLGAASLMCLVHAPALLGLIAAGNRVRFTALSGALFILGVLLFAGDLVKRHFAGTGLFPMSAPSGGMIMMAGWLVVGAGALLHGQQKA
ncbi:DUF423 domain-containing protein [Rhizobium sp. C4]|uniref:DUF423 domain-containing protein n=1 Tax=Rhizobium sp. C4 TaxID=1349800 RepID=UPI001E6008F9|nr:DUF423 domain-containing protein [Rhizobium sp. C4]MCD2173781.1 DUF423 domain-containing protein [Rhizobium sp. C4]